MHWPSSLRYKFTFAIFLLLVVFFTMAIVVSLFRLIPKERSKILHNAETSTELAVGGIVRTYLTNNGTVGSKLSTAMRPIAERLPYIDYFRIVDTQGKPVYDSRTLKRSVILDPITDTETLSAIQSNKSSSLDKNGQRSYIQPYIDEQGQHTHTVQFFVSFAELDAWINDVLWQILVLAALYIPVTIIFLIWLIQKYIITPTEHLRSESNIIAAGDFDQRFDIKTRDEMGSLAQNLNNTIEVLTTQIKTLEEEKAWKNEFLTLASHNLRSPLSVILSASNSLKRETGLSEQGKKFVDYISSRGKELHTLIENMLSISLLKGDKLMMKEEPFNLMAVIEKAAKEQETHLKEKKIKLQIEAVPHQVIVNGSEGQIFQVVDNVLDNAIKFTPESGIITIKVEETSQDVLVSIKDSGVGIDAAIINKLFQSFHRGSDPLSVENRGAGLGLYFVKLAIEAHGGEVSIRSQQGKGTEISFRLPKITT